MDQILTILFLASICALIAGLFRPSLFEWLLHERATRKGIATRFSILAFIILFFLGSTGETNQVKPDEIVNEAATPSEKSEMQSDHLENTLLEKTTEAPIPRYQVLHALSGKRYDGGKNFYVLIDPIDLASENFKSDIKSIVRDIVTKEGAKTSVEIYDNRAALDLAYRQYGEMSLGRPYTEMEFDERAVHLIADYSGDLETGAYLNTLWFFPGAFKNEHVLVAEHIETMEFNGNGAGTN